MIEIVAPGPLCTVQDRGRRGMAHLGVGHSGAADVAAHDLANRLVGNPPGSATLECTFGGLVFVAIDACLVATAGADCAVTVSGGPPMGHQQPMALPAGATVSIGPPSRGLRTYVAVRGGIDTPVIVGSRSTDLLSGLGPPPLAAGTIVAIGPDPATAVPTELAPPPLPTAAPLLLWPGPRREWFSDAAIAALVSGPYAVTGDSNRVGVRLRGAPLGRRVDLELPSEGVVDGAMQVPADGQPLVLIADHGTTGGYPVIAVVDPGDLSRMAQARPGDTLRFRWR